MSKSPCSKPANTADQSWISVIINDTTKLVAEQTWRNEDGSNENDVITALQNIQAHFQSKADLIRDKNGKALVTPFEWQGSNDDKKYWVFGYRAGTGTKKVSVICHLDTVPPGNEDWDPFTVRLEQRLYKGVPMDFLIGRGTIDDKGPAVVAFEAFTRAVQQAADTPDALAKVTLEVLFDTSEETDMSTSHYFDANPAEQPAFGIVFDAMWAVRAEKGVERPTFTVSAKQLLTSGQAAALSIASLSTPSGAVNMIPFTAEARIIGPPNEVEQFAKNVEAWYRTCPFDDPAYQPAALNIKVSTTEVVLTTQVAGAQHGSAPHQNRADGANPVVSLTNFLASLLERGVIAHTYQAELCRFIRWAFGTRVFGENHPDLLYRSDAIFPEGNGTTYALTKLVDDPKHRTISLGIDVRYAIGHHAQGWDGSEGKIAGDSLFTSVFSQLVQQYQSEAGGASLTWATRTGFGPDIRSPHDANLFRINMAYRSVMGSNVPMLAVGGGTDAHGYLNLVTAGTLFTDSFGPPINYHGLDEGAPLLDLENSGKILLQLLQQELGL